ncbi:hypothetical protein BJV85_003401 [Clostridium acetobutylicum]|uniref:Uncharacterized protein n=1 Tax=Clostridium acetobutylicum (strain ATCC 824 / DSM 792 / JCM 1419 / IAM 19013 / LMG 5710 / NBRC 13948 / NRRL B-527 / VKM B-1787 / 2291 / W) TaxID=272562 RepID=Q97LF1_CLOAB|nr:MULTISPECIES: hypothetical protein [Clostridium]AAK78588.1 Hypothetical protein CA_C0610 [Clostridium acetobutylicum ATCC 824]ADZ19662.1 Conserved hypothetical protein [Clostridium acetobutylicum EA 2018]AEI31334.1 hypothetical protein SMB_G0624 [Clostridium acetobutylicum DSM 1731]AWV80312.1 hypothetical protein DK921_09425 [Clostridium acetobutylicum]MBC2392497.1 hypothetical protein [Clostridium acetobutylicum]
MNNKKNPINKLFSSIDNLFAGEREQNLRVKLGKAIKNSIFTDEIITKLYENDFTGLVEEENKISSLFSIIFPVYVKKSSSSFRLYKHKIELNLPEENARYIYIFDDGRLTSDSFHCFRLYDDTYVDKLSKIISLIPLFKEAINSALDNFEKNINTYDEKILDTNKKELLAEDNFKFLINKLSPK